MWGLDGGGGSYVCGTKLVGGMWVDAGAFYLVRGDTLMTPTTPPFWCAALGRVDPVFLERT